MTDAVFDASVLDRLAMDLGDPTPVHDLIDTFLAEARRNVERMQAGLKRLLAEEVARGAHSLKSSSAMVGALRVSALARDLEMLAKAGNLVAIEERLEQLVGIFPDVERGLKTWAVK